MIDLEDDLPPEAAPVVPDPDEAADRAHVERLVNKLRERLAVDHVLAVMLRWTSPLSFGRDGDDAFAHDGEQTIRLTDEGITLGTVKWSGVVTVPW